MKFAIYSTVLAAFFTFVFATPMKGRPVAPSASATKIECSMQKTCDDCIAVKGESGSPMCGYSPTNNACVELPSAGSASPGSLKLAHTIADCKPTSSQQSTDQQTPDVPKTTVASQNTETQEGGNEKPAGEDTTTVTAQHKLLPSTITCDTNTYSGTDIQAAIKDGHAHINNTMGSRKYPHTYGNIENLDMGSCAKKPYYEFPILETHNIYNGGEPYTDRVVFDCDGNYCAVITHTGAPRGKFVSCVDSVSSTTTPSSTR